MMKSIFRPYESDSLTLSNRIVMAPMTRSRSDQRTHQANELMATYYAQRASAGLMISEGIWVSPQAAGYINVPGLYTDSQVDSWRPVTTAVHEKRGRLFAQLWHVGRISHPDFHGGALPLAPSAIDPEVKSFTPDGFKPTVTPKAMTIEDIYQTVADFRQAASNALAAGFDGVELHAANGYLFHQFFAQCANDRTDEYGGSIANRIRFLFDVLDAVTEVVPSKKVGIRLNPDLEGSFGIEKDPETELLFETVARRLNDYNLAYLHLSGFSKNEAGTSTSQIRATAARFRQLFNGCLMINKGFDAATGSEAIDAGVADLVSFGIPFIANPDLVYRYQHQKPLNIADRSTFYTSGAKGYIDYPFWSEANER